jgi:hypothetical protein
MDSNYYYKYLKYKQKYIELINNLTAGKPPKAKADKSAGEAVSTPPSKDTKLIEDINKLHTKDKELIKMMQSNHEMSKELMQRNKENKLPLQIYLETGKLNKAIIDNLLPLSSNIEQFLTIQNITGDPIMHWIKFTLKDEDLFNYLSEKFGDQVNRIRNKDGRTIPELEKVLETKQAKDSKKQVSASLFSPEQQKYLDLIKKKIIKGDYTDEYTQICDSDEMQYLIMGIDEINRLVEEGVTFQIVFINSALKDDDNYLLLVPNDGVHNLKAARTNSALDTLDGKKFSIHGLIHKDTREFYDTL